MVYQYNNWNLILWAKLHNCFHTLQFYLIWLNFLSVVKSAETSKYATPTGHLNSHFASIMESYEYSHDEIKNTSIFTWQYSCSRSLWKNSSWVTWKRAAKRHYVEVASMCCTTQCMWLDCVCFENHWKHLVKWLLVLQTCVSHHALFQSGETRLSVTSLNQSLGTMIAKVHIASHSPTLFTQIQLVHNACPTGNLGSMQYSWTHSLMCSSTLLFSTVSSWLLFLVLVSWCVVYRKILKRVQIVV